MERHKNISDDLQPKFIKYGVAHNPGACFGMIVPPLWGLRQTLRAHPALKRWAKLFRPYGTRAGPLQVGREPHLRETALPNICFFGESSFGTTAKQKTRCPALHFSVGHAPAKSGGRNN
jgi:hypothetical protein